jgi:hypothetical protein
MNRDAGLRSLFLAFPIAPGKISAEEPRPACNAWLAEEVVWLGSEIRRRKSPERAAARYRSHP